MSRNPKVISFTTLILFLFCSISTNAQVKKTLRTQVDSLVISINSEMHDSTKALIYLEISNLMEGLHIDSIQPYCDKADSIIQNQNFEHLERKVIETFRNIELEVLFIRAWLLREKGKISESMNIFHGIIQKSNEYGFKQTEAGANMFLGFLQGSLDQNEMAFTSHFNSLQLYTEIDSKIEIGRAENNLAHMYRKLGNDSLGIVYGMSAYQKVKSQDSTSFIFLYCLNFLCDYYMDYNNLDSAFKYCSEAERLIPFAFDNHGKIGIYNAVSKYYFKKENYEMSKLKLDSAMKYALVSGNPRYLAEVYILKSKIAEHYENYRETLNYLKLFIQMTDSIKSNKNIMTSLGFELEKERLMAQKELEKQEAESRARNLRNRIIISAILFILILVIVFTWILLKRLKISKQQKTEIDKQHLELKSTHKKVTDSIKYAKRIQSAILPPNKLVKEYLTNSFIFYKPKDVVAGDFYWLETQEFDNPNEKLLLFAAADCTGHGVPGAMVSVVCNNGLNRSVREYGLKDPSEILEKTREIVIQEFEKSDEVVQDGMDIAMCTLYDKNLEFAGANNPLWIIRNGTSEVEVIKGDKQHIGRDDKLKSFHTHKIQLYSGDCFYIFSDGFVDQFGGDFNKKFMSSRFKKLLIDIHKEPMEIQGNLLENAFQNWKGNNEQLDDVCVIGVRV